MTSMRKPQKTFIAVAISIVLFFLFFTACSSSKNDIVFTEKVNDQYASIVLSDKEYVPFCAITSSKDIGAYLGYMEGDENMKVYNFRDCSNEEWIIQSGYGCSMLYREINVKNIPDGLTSEYEWNN